MLTDITVLILNIIEKWGVQGILGIVLVFLHIAGLILVMCILFFCFFKDKKEKQAETYHK